jgi:hypothetical protein
VHIAPEGAPAVKPWRADRHEVSDLHHGRRIT